MGHTVGWFQISLSIGHVVDVEGDNSRRQVGERERQFSEGPSSDAVGAAELLEGREADAQLLGYSLFRQMEKLLTKGTHG